MEVLHVAAGDKAGLVLDDGAGSVSFDLIFLRASDDAHVGGVRHEMPCVVGGAGGKLSLRGAAPEVLVGALHCLLVGFRLDNRECCG